MSSAVTTGLIIIVVAAIGMVVTIAMAYGRRSEQRRAQGLEVVDSEETADRGEVASDGSRL